MLILIVIIYLSLLRSESPKIPPPSSPRGKATRVVGVVLGVMLIGSFLYSVVAGGVTEPNIMLTLSAIIITTLIFIVAKNKASK
jgi:hypothetical protein